jgi:hypothetical protein
VRIKNENPFPSRERARVRVIRHCKYDIYVLNVFLREKYQIIRVFTLVQNRYFKK